MWLHNVLSKHEVAEPMEVDGEPTAWTGLIAIRSFVTPCAMHPLQTILQFLSQYSFLWQI